MDEKALQGCEGTRIRSAGLYWIRASTRSTVRLRLDLVERKRFRSRHRLVSLFDKATLVYLYALVGRLRSGIANL